MRLVSFLGADGAPSYGTTDGTVLRDAGRQMAADYPDLRAVIAAGAVGALEGTGPEMPLADVSLLPPIPAPEKILCIGLNYLPHILETGRPKPEYPSIFTRYPDSVVAHGQAMIRPAAMLPSRPHTSGPNPWVWARRNPAANASPAPVVSTTS